MCVMHNLNTGNERLGLEIREKIPFFISKIEILEIRHFTENNQSIGLHNQTAVVWLMSELH